MKHVAVAVLLLAMLGVAACGGDEPAQPADEEAGAPSGESATPGASSADGGTDADLTAVARTMQAREEATLPFSAKYKGVVRLKGDLREDLAYSGEVTWGPHAHSWRQRFKSPRPVRPGEDPGSTELLTMESFTATYGGKHLIMNRRLDGPQRSWSGSLLPRPPPHGRFTPACFGLCYLDRADRFYSAYVGMDVARALEHRRFKNWECLRVLTDFSPEATVEITRPLEIWLAKDRGYMPVRVVLWGSADSTRYEHADRMMWRGKELKPKAIYEVYELAKVGEGYLPVRCRLTSPYATGSSQVDLTVPSESLRSGVELSRDAAELPIDVEGVVVRDSTTNQRVIVGAAWAKVAPEQIMEAVKHRVPVAFENDLGMRFVLIPAGTFLMGSPEDEDGRDEDEVQREVTISKPFYMQITEVTNAQYRHWRPDNDAYESKGRSWNGDQQPAGKTRWNDATAYAAWMNSRDDLRTYRLPSEAEWEYACRAGTTTPFWFGETISTDQAHFNGIHDAHGSGRKRVHRLVTIKVGSYPPNGWSLYDMHGNASEWCRDWYANDLGSRPATDPPGPSSGSYRVQRGGDWGNIPWRVRSADRTRERPRVYGPGFGFRLVSPLRPR